MKTVVKTAILAFVVFSSSIGLAQKTETSALISNLIGDTTLDLPETYSFEKSIQLKIVSQKQNSKNTELQYLLRFPQNGEYMMMISTVKNGETTDESELLIDFDQMQMISFLDAIYANMAVIRPIEASMLINHDDIASKYGELTKMKRKKKIAGHLAQEYKFDCGEQSGSLWIAEDLKTDLLHSFDALGLEVSTKEGNSGVIMAVESLDKVTGKKTLSQIEQLNLHDPFTLYTNRYIPTRLPEAIEEK